MVDDQKLDRIARALNEAMPATVKRHYAFPLGELRKLARAALLSAEEPTDEPILHGADLVEAIRRKCPVSTDVED